MLNQGAPINPPVCVDYFHTPTYPVTLALARHLGKSLRSRISLGFGSGANTLHFTVPVEKNGEHLKIYRLLSARGATVEEKSQNLVDLLKMPTALFDAVKRGDVESVKAELARGADVNGKDETGRTPLVYAAKSGSASIVSLLLESRAKVDKLSDQKRDCDLSETSLMLASTAGYLSVVKLLLKHGANPTESFDDFSCGDSLGSPLSNSLGMAAKNGHVAVFNELLGKVELSQNSPMAPLLVLIKFVTEQKPFLEAKNIHAFIARSHPNDTLVQAAAFFGKREILKFLISKKLNVNTHENMHLDYSKDEFFDETPLILAIRAKQKEIVNDLINAGADVNSEDKFGRTALTEAVKNDDLETLKILVGKKAKVNTQIKLKCGEEPTLKPTEAYYERLDPTLEKRERKGCSPLMLAAINGNSKTVGFLLEHATSKSLRDFDGRSAYDFAKSKGHQHLLSALK